QAEQSDRCQQQPGDDRPGPGERDPRLAGPEPGADARAEERRPEPRRAAPPTGVDDGRFAELGQLPVDVEERFTHRRPPGPILWVAGLRCPARPPRPSLEGAGSPPR